MSIQKLTRIALATVITAGAAVAQAQDIKIANIVEMSGPGTTSGVMFKQGVEMAIKEINAKGDPAEVAGSGVAKLMGLLISQSKGTMPMKAAIPAATVLLCEGLSFMEEAGRIKVDKNVLAKAMRALSSGLLQLFGVTPDKLGQMMQKQKQQPQQPPMGIVGKARGMA